MGLLDSTLIRGLLLAGATALLVGVVAHFGTSARLQDTDVQACRARAIQLTVTLGTELLEPATMPAGSASHAALRRLLRHDPRIQSMYTVARQGGRDVVVLSVARVGETLPAGTPLQLTKQGHRTYRVGEATVEDGSPIIVRAPIPAPSGDIAGLLVVETARASTMFAFASGWTLFVLPLLAAAAMGLWLLLRVARPMARVREILVDVDPEMPEPATLAEAAESLADLIDRFAEDKNVLEAQVRQRTQQLKESRKTRDEVLANTVHELRTPLSTIVATLNILQTMDGLTEDENAEFLAQAAAACQHMKFLINDILDSAAIEDGKIKVQPRNCSLHKIFRAAERVMQPSALASSIELQLELGDQDIHVFSDQSRVLQVLFNLLSNAIKYSPDARTVTLRAMANPLAAVIEVEDEGEGVPLASRARLFTKFTRLPRDRRHAVEGSGIGLYLSKRLVEMMNGSIGYRRRGEDEETGSVFWFTLPLGKAPTEPALIAESEQGDGA
ncbi:MAG: sensor histidine kinase [Planctomycetota bacterium]